MGKAEDLKSVTKVFTEHMFVAPSRFKIIDTVRLHGGVKDRNYSADPRPLKVCFENAEMVSKIVSETRLINDSDDQEIRKIKIFRDRTKDEREERKRLIAEAVDKSREESDEAYKWIVDYNRKLVVRVTKDYRKQRPFRQRKYI